METVSIKGIAINKIPLKDLLFNRTMLLGYLLFAFGLWGIWDVFAERYFLLSANAHDAALHPGSREVAEAMREAIFGPGGEVLRESPWTLYIVNYMYMIYSGSGMILLVALGEIFDMKIIKKTAAGFMTFGLAMVFGGLFTIALDLNILHMHWMFLSPNVGAGMWLMLPLYLVYIPFVLFEIYLLITEHHAWAKKIAYPVLILSLLIDFIEYFIQAKLFNMNTARHLWTTYPGLTFYFIVSASVAAIGIMLLYAITVYRRRLGDEFEALIDLLRRTSLYLIGALAVYEAIAFVFVDKAWGGLLLFGSFRYAFFVYLFLAIALPFVLESRRGQWVWSLGGALSIVIGTYLGRYLFVYGGNAVPMSDRFGTGVEKYGEYEALKEVVTSSPHLPEILVVVGSLGVVLIVYTLIDRLLSISAVREH
jgi:hypothetical protein